MQDVEDFRGLIGLWPSARAFAREVAGEDSQEQGRVWARRNRVPRCYFPMITVMALRRKIKGCTTEFLERLYEAGRGQGR